MAKKKKIDSKKLKKEIMGGSDEEQMQRLIKILLIVVLFIGLVWFVFAIINGEIFGKKKAEKEEVEIQNDVILAGSTFNRSEDEYYVLLYDFEGANSGTCSAIFNIYKDKSEVKMFKVDLNDKMNANVLVTDSGEVNTSSSANLKVLDATLIKVKDGKAVEVKSGISELNEFKSTLLN